MARPDHLKEARDPVEIRMNPFQMKEQTEHD